MKQTEKMKSKENTQPKVTLDNWKEELESKFDTLKTVTGNEYWIVESPEEIINDVKSLLEEQRKEIDQLKREIDKDYKGYRF